MQYFVTPADVGDEAYNNVQDGDIVAPLAGQLFRTNRVNCSVAGQAQGPAPTQNVLPPTLCDLIT